MKNCKNCQIIECYRWGANRPACSYYLTDKTCWDCMQRIGEECGITGEEVYMDSEVCGSFETLD